MVVFELSETVTLYLHWAVSRRSSPLFQSRNHPLEILRLHKVDFLAVDGFEGRHKIH